MATKKLIISKGVRLDGTLLCRDIILEPGKVIIPVYDSSDDRDPGDSDSDDDSMPIAPAAPATAKERSTGSTYTHTYPHPNSCARPASTTITI